MRIQKTTSEDIARATGVSRATVSYVLNNRPGMRISPETRARVLDAAQAVGYQPNRLAAALSTGRIHTVGLVTPPQGLTVRGTTYSQDLFLELSLAAAEAKMNALIFLERIAAPDAETGLRPKDLMDGRVDGVIVFGQYDHPEWVEAVSETELPCVEIGSSWGRVSVHTDNRGGIRAGVEHLLALGHRRIAYWSPERETPTVQTRAAGFRDTLRAHGIPAEATPLLFDATSETLASLLTRSDRPTAVMTFNDDMAVQALDVFLDLGLRVPEDVSLVGFDDDIRAVTARPQLTTVANPLRLMARTAMTKLMEQIEKRSREPSATYIPAHLVVRDSTAPLNT